MIAWSRRREAWHGSQYGRDRRVRNDAATGAASGSTLSFTGVVLPRSAHNAVATMSRTNSCPAVVPTTTWRRSALGDTRVISDAYSGFDLGAQKVRKKSARTDSSPTLPTANHQVTCVFATYSPWCSGRTNRLCKAGFRIEVPARALPPA
jgi:hypothetical protein